MNDFAGFPRSVHLAFNYNHYSLESAKKSGKNYYFSFGKELAASDNIYQEEISFKLWLMPAGRKKCVWTDY
jgi:hypothetical protein